MRKLILLSFISLFLIKPLAKADEGMWIPVLIEQFNIKLMQEKGFKLTSADIYSVNQACMKDAVMIFGRGCTGELISPEGLLITNHHCGYGRIQAHSSLEHDYLTDGFWAMSREEELANPGLSVTFLKQMEEVTGKVMKGVKKKMDEKERNEIINYNISLITEEAIRGTGYSALVKPFFMGNQYFLFVSETFRDVRLVGAPPSAIGKFGGETDNWIWPRHTGDFSLFRIYADDKNKPADYSEDNVPYKPAYHFPISLKGVHEGDFTMIFGYPGSTNQYVSSFHIAMLIDYVYPDLIAVRTKKLDIIVADMDADPQVRIQYSSKKSGIANSWKRWIGEKSGMSKLGTVRQKQEFEKGFTEWVESNRKRRKMYGDILFEYETVYDEYKVYRLVSSFTNEIVGRSGIEAVNFARSLKPLTQAVDNGDSPEDIQKTVDSLRKTSQRFFKNYNMPTDKKLFVTLMEMYGNTLNDKWQADYYKKLYEKTDGDFSLLAENLYSESIFTNEKRFNDFIDVFNASGITTVTDDPIFIFADEVAVFLRDKVIPLYRQSGEKIAQLDRRYMTAQLEYAGDRVLWPDANFTLRVGYGNIGGYDARDAVYHTHYTTLRGIMEKDNPEIYDYNVPEKLRELYRSKDYGRYAQEGEIPVCFIANNHTTGGNSGSPVINGDGHLIGINFDRAWEGVMSDFMFNPKQSRNISIDIRYALFLIDKFAGAGYLLDEMTLVE